MSASLPQARRASQINSIDAIRRRAVKVTSLNNVQSTPINDPATPDNSVDCGWVDALHDVIDAAGKSRKEGAYDLGVDPAQLSRGAVTLDRLKKLPLVMQQDYLELMCVRAGLKVSRASQHDELIQIAEYAALALINALKARTEE